MQVDLQLRHRERPPAAVSQGAGGRARRWMRVPSTAGWLPAAATLPGKATLIPLEAAAGGLAPFLIGKSLFHVPLLIRKQSRPLLTLIT